MSNEQDHVRVLVMPEEVVMEQWAAGSLSRRRALPITELSQVLAAVQAGVTGQATTDLGAITHTLDLFPHGGFWQERQDGTIGGVWKVQPLPLPLLSRGMRVTGWPENVSILMGAVWNRGVVQVSHVWVATTAVDSADQPASIRPWPCGNVYPDGHICWGTVVVQALAPAMYPLLSRQFFESAFNGDLVVPGWAQDAAGRITFPDTTGQHQTTVRELLRTALYFRRS